MTPLRIGNRNCFEQSARIGMRRVPEDTVDGTLLDDAVQLHPKVALAGGRFLDVETAFRDRQTRRLRWETLDEDVAYGAQALDRAVVAKDQIRTVVRTFKERLFTEIFPGRTEVPKALIFAKDDSHADDIVQIVREEFGKGNDFAQKITYKTGTARVVTKKVLPDGGIKIYLQPDAASRLWASLASVVRPGGVLVLGKAERPLGAPGLAADGSCVYRRVGGRDGAWA